MMFYLYLFKLYGILIELGQLQTFPSFSCLLHAVCYIYMIISRINLHEKLSVLHVWHCLIYISHSNKYNKLWNIWYYPVCDRILFYLHMSSLVLLALSTQCPSFTSVKMRLYLYIARVSCNNALLALYPTSQYFFNRSFGQSNEEERWERNHDKRPIFWEKRIVEV